VPIKLSDYDLRRRDLVTAISSILADVSLAPEHLELEVSERSSVQPPQSLAADNLQGLRDLRAHRSHSCANRTLISAP
jgi:predicted signal transduction protein with EAL and GGDEF domain